MSGEGGRPTVAFYAAEEDPSSAGQVGREIRPGESQGKGPETAQSRSEDDPMQVTFPGIWWNGDTPSEQARTVRMRAHGRTGRVH